MKAVIFAQQSDASDMCSAVAQLMGFPRAGTHVGGGVHVPMPVSYSPGAPGWTDGYVQPFKHPTLPQWAVPTDAAVDALNGQKATVMAKQITVNTAPEIDLPPDWTPAVVLPSQAQVIP